MLAKIRRTRVELAILLSAHPLPTAFATRHRRLPSLRTPSRRSTRCAQRMPIAPRSSSLRDCAFRDGAFKATRGVAIALVSSREREHRQPGLAADDPVFVGWRELIRGVQGAQVHFNLVCAARENRRAAARTEEPARVITRFTFDRHRVLRKDRGSVKQRPMMLAAVEAVTNADPVGEPRGHNADIAAQATARESVHAVSPRNQAPWLQHNPIMAIRAADGNVSFCPTPQREERRIDARP